LTQEMNAESLFQVSRTGTDSKAITQAANDGISLEIGKSIEKQIAMGQTDSYRLTLMEGQYVRVVVEQKGIDVVVVLLGPDGKKLDEVNHRGALQATELLSFIATIPGNYRVEVHPKANDAPAGRYEIKIADLRIATDRDQKQIIAEKTRKQ